MTLVLVVEFVDRTTTVYPNWEDFIKDMKQKYPRLRFGTMFLAIPEWTAQRLLQQKGSSIGLMVGSEIMGKVIVRALPE